jgi:Cof subfamily protein (haloacid dehalogenase superfamily)
MTESSSAHRWPSRIRLVVADVDGTLVTPDKILTPRARAAVRQIAEADIAFTITSGRPPRGMKALIDDLQVRSPIAAFNGGLFVRPDLSILRRHVISREAATSVIDIMTRGGLDVWLDTDNDWYVKSRHGPHVDREVWTVKYDPVVISTFDGVQGSITKIVGVTDDPELMTRCLEGIRHRRGQPVSAALSQPYYLDVTHPKANKAEVISALSEWLGVPTAQIAAIGDMPSDVLMFERSGMSIAMANANDDVQRAATFVTSANTEDGFARAIERFVLGDGPGRDEQWSAELGYRSQS